MSLPSWAATDALAKEEFVRLKQIIGDRLSPVDRSLVVDYCTLTAEIRRLQEMVEEEGHKLTGPKGGEYLNPTVTLLMQKQSLLANLRRDLFFTPRSRGEKAKPSGKALSIREKLDVDDEIED